ncbi:MAG: hypothetical protein GOMPHAMPRED_007253 [Gomphillus americanus]|uniref:Mitochondrial carrier n=1 Tax=Gomphillus americanus TaxID=1940652 RepID=A0A8H3I153_9LECA|nr:MAG: hypothetical protein GOMPHAMPRED_007253 [Gomphillus americanus]
MSSISPLAPRPDNLKHWAKRYRTELAASSSTVLSTLIAFPLESVKTRIQSYPDSFVNCVQKTFRDEGLKGFWRGVAAPLVSITAVRTLSFSVYQKAKYKASATIGGLTGEDEPLIVVNRPGSIPNWGTILCFGSAGAAAGAASTLLACPFELTKNAMVISKQIASSGVGTKAHPIRSSYQNKNTFLTARQIVRNCGVMGLYSGFQLQILRETFGTAIYFMAYESLKQIVVKYEKTQSPTSPFAVAIAGGCSGIISLVSTYPLDRAKTAYQRACLERGQSRPNVKYNIEYFKRASYQGVVVAASRSAITNAVLFSTFEYVKKRINALPDPDREA